MRNLDRRGKTMLLHEARRLLALGFYHRAPRYKGLASVSHKEGGIEFGGRGLEEGEEPLDAHVKIKARVPMPECVFCHERVHFNDLDYVSSGDAELPAHKQCADSWRDSRYITTTSSYPGRR